MLCTSLRKCIAQRQNQWETQYWIVFSLVCLGAGVAFSQQPLHFNLIYRVNFFCVWDQRMAIVMPSTLTDTRTKCFIGNIQTNCNTVVCWTLLQKKPLKSGQAKSTTCAIVHQTKTKHFIAQLFAQPSTLKTSFEYVCPRCGLISYTIVDFSFFGSL